MWAPTAGPVQAKSFGLTCPVAPDVCECEEVCIASIPWFLATWLLSVEVAKVACVPRPDHATKATPIVARKVTLYWPVHSPLEVPIFQI